MILHVVTARDGRMVAQAWIASRGLILLVALLLALQRGWSLTEMVSNWDVEHFINLAEHGYFGRADGTLMAFFPGLPVLLSAGLHAGIPIAITGMVLAAVGSVAAAAALTRLGGPWAAVTWLFAPTAVFTTVPYTESLFCATAFWAWERARADRWAAAAVLAAAACTFRVSGLFLVGALFVMILTSRGIPVATRTRRCGSLLLPLAVIAAFVGYLHRLTSSWTAWYSAQSTGWERSFTAPLDSFWNTVAAAHPSYFPDHPLWPPVFAAEIVSMSIGLLVTGWCLGRRLWAEASWVGIQLLAFSISFWFFSVNRAILLWFPLWMMLAELGSWRPRRVVPRVVWRTVVVAGCVVGTALMMVWSWLFFTGNWAS